MKTSVICRAHHMLDLASENMFRIDVEAMRCVIHGVRKKEDAERIAKRLKLKTMTRGLIAHDRVLTGDKRGEWYAWL